MILRQFLHREPVAVSYLVGCAGKGLGAVIEPLDPIEVYLEAAAAAGTPIQLVIDTHLHADHRSSGRELARATGADYALHASARTGYDFRALNDGERIELGNVALDVLHTPGHTPEHLCLLVTDRTRAAEAWFVMTGHTLMIGDVGRTELVDDARAGALTLFATLKRLKALPEHLEVFPGAFAGSVCGRGLSGKPTSTIGFEKRYNAAFALSDPERFVEFMLENTPPAPQQAVELRAWNAGLTPGKAA